MTGLGLVLTSMNILLTCPNVAGIFSTVLYNLCCLSKVSVQNVSLESPCSICFSVLIDVAKHTIKTLSAIRYTTRHIAAEPSLDRSRFTPYILVFRPVLERPMQPKCQYNRANRWAKCVHHSRATLCVFSILWPDSSACFGRRDSRCRRRGEVIPGTYQHRHD